MLSPDLVKGPWQKTEDEIITKVNRTAFVALLDFRLLQCKADGMTKWSEIAKHIPGRVGKQVRPRQVLQAIASPATLQCRERWLNHLDPSLKHGAWTEEEDQVLIAKQVFLHAHQLGLSQI